MRKIVQIIESPETERNASSLIVLCDDGTIWSFASGEWGLFNHPIPQDKDLK